MLPAKLNTLAKLSPEDLPKKWQPRYVLKRIGDEDIDIPWSTRNEILEQLARGGKYVQIGEYTIMLNAIKSIDPYWGAKNIPPMPSEYVTEGVHYDTLSNTYKSSMKKNPEYEEWNKYFSNENNKL